MKLGMTSLTLRNCSPREVIDYAVEAGLQGIEWGETDSHVVIGDLERARCICDMCQSASIDSFALGSYCRMEDISDATELVKTAEALGTDVIRVWAGTKSPCECDDAYMDLIVTNTRTLADIADGLGIKIAFEFHGDTLTETAESAIELIKLIDRANVALYWQPDFKLDSVENLAARNKVLPYCIGNMHIQNYSPDSGYGLLEEIKDKLIKYYGDIKDKPYNLMIEFVKDGTAENLIKDADALKKVIREKN